MRPKAEEEKLREQGLNHHKQGDLIHAEKCYRQAMRTGHVDQLILINLGVICRETGRPEEALCLHKNAIKIDPHNPVPYGNISNLYRNLGKLDQALIATLKSQELRPHSPDIHMTLGDIYKDLGKLDQALTSTLKSIDLRPMNPNAQMNLGIIYEVNHEKEKALEHYLISSKLYERYKKYSGITCIISALLIMIQLGSLQEAKRSLIKIPRLRQKTKQDSIDCNKKNRIHDDAYFIFIQALLKEIPEDFEPNTSKSLHIGESHSLAFTNQSISINGIKSTIKPELVKGAKAWHLASSQINSHKVCFQNAVKEKLDDYKSILLSFGEIDCRQNEGILQHCIKYNLSLEKVSRNTARDYIRWVQNMLLKHKEKLIILGTPAPLKHNCIDDIAPSPKDYQHSLLIQHFNKSLADECSSSGIIFADVYGLTADKSGFNNNEWMIDNCHLKSTAIQEIIRNHLIQPNRQELWPKL